jgi:glycogen debranching enzyme
MGAQPPLHELVTCLHAPATWLSPAHGQLSGNADGLYVADRRVLSRLELRVGGGAPVPLRGTPVAADEAVFLGSLPWLGDPATPDPTVWCERTRRARPDGGRETILLRNTTREPLTVEVTVSIGADLTTVSAVKSGRYGPPGPPEPGPDGELVWSAPDGLTVTLTAVPAPTVKGAELTWTAALPAGGEWSARLDIRATPPETTGFRPLAPSGPPPWAAAPLTVTADDRRLDALVRTGVADLGALLLADPSHPSDVYAAGGSPWYLTLFARDAIWAALLGLPLGPGLTGGTLRTLARRQGTRVDPGAEEAPGKIPHELRPTDAAVFLPPVYYGTVDATPLFVVLLHRAWRWGLPPAEVAALLPAAERALGWLAAHGDPDGDGFVEYVPTGAGLANQGWKDSGDGIQHADGRLATPPVALAEVQGYAYRAALDGADLLDAFGRPGARRWREWAARLADRFRGAFWVSDADGPYPAIALEAGKSPVDGPASNMGHLLGTGLLDAEEERLVAARLAGPALASGYGLRTLARTAAGFNPLGYHAGSVWPHDTAIAVLGLVRGGHHGAARGLIAGLLAAGAAFDFRLPELYGGQSRYPTPVPYPAACRPQAWAAATGPALVQALLGLDVDVPGGRLTLRPMAPSPVGAYLVDGVSLGGAGRLAVGVDAAGRVTEISAPPGLRLDLP